MSIRSSRISFCLVLLVILLNVLNYSLAAVGDNCKTPNAIGGKCSYLINCPVLRKLTQNLVISQQDKLFLRNSICPPDGSNVMYCCPDSAIPGTDMCGIGPDNKIFGGGEADLSEFPWMVLLEYTKPNGKNFHCGGMMISSRYVLTAAHCVESNFIPKDWKLTSVRLGEHDISKEPDCDEDECALTPLDVDIESVKIHEGYNKDNINIHDDIALLRLTKDVVYATSRLPICLPLINPLMKPEEQYEGIDYTVAGWGITEKNDSLRSDVLKKLNVSIVNHDECARLYKSLGFDLTDKQLCAGGVQREDTCQGDSGGPLMAIRFNDKRTASWYLIGIISFGPLKCGVQGIPGVYTRVDKYNDWIKNNIFP